MPAKSNAGRPPYKPTKQDKKTVWTMAASGIRQKDIAACIADGIALKTLRKHFRNELDTAMIEANAKIGKTIFEQAMAGAYRSI